jgi:hypothetical protein
MKAIAANLNSVGQRNQDLLVLQVFEFIEVNEAQEVPVSEAYFTLLVPI